MASTSKYGHPSIPQTALKVIKDYSYSLADTIGHGYSSSVYRGQHDPTGDAAAIKVINVKMFKNKGCKDLLSSEIACLKRMKGCSNVIQLKDVFESVNNTYIITQICPLGDLDKHLAQRKLPEKKAQEYMKQILTGYLETQGKGIVHRDLKPANIFVGRNGLKIADFGFAALESQCRKSQVNVGSPLYMPPEALKHNEYSFKSDIWALGVIYFEMLFGRTPWRTSTEKQLPNKILSQGISKLIPTGSVSTKSLQFLLRTLNIEVKYRMSPQELGRFSFDLVDHGSKSSTVNLMSNYAKRSFITGQLNYHSQVPSYKTNTLDLLEDKPVSKLAGDINREKHLSPRTDSSEKNSEELIKEFLSQVHLCRFIYKIINSLKEVAGEHGALKDVLSQYVFRKLEKILSMDSDNPFNLQNLDQFRETFQYKKIMTVSRKYLSKYQTELGVTKKDSNEKIVRGVYDQLEFALANLWRTVDNVSSESIEIFQKEVILVDYLMTTYLLVKLESRSDLTNFHSKSKIEEIVEGNTHKVTMDHYRAIREKVKSLKFC